MEETEGTITEERDPGGRIPLATEILAYLGGAFAAVAAAALLGMFWDPLGPAGRLGITGLLAAACIVAGVVIGRIGDRAASRLRQFLLLFGVGAVGAFAGIAAWQVLDPLIKVPFDNPEMRIGAGEWSMFVAFLTVAVVGGVVYLRYRQVVPQVVFGGGVAAAALFGTMVAYGRNDVPSWLTAAVLILVGLVWGALGLRGLLAPGENTALAISGATVYIGLLLLWSWGPESAAREVPGQWAMYVALAGGLLFLAAGVALKRLVTVGFGAASVVTLIPTTLGEVFSSSVTVPVSILLLGVALIGVAIGIALRPGRPAKAAATSETLGAGAGVGAPPAAPRRVPVATEILGYIGGAFCMGGGIALILGYADQIGIWGQIALCGVAAAVGLAGGAAIGRNEDKGAKRLEQFLLAVGVTGAGAMVGLGAFRLVESGILATAGVLGPGKADEWAWFLGPAVSAIVGGIVWWFRRTWMQQIVFGVALAMASVTVLAIPDDPGPTWVVGLVLALLGLAWGALGFRGWMEPTNAALALGALGIVGGCMAMAIGPENAEYVQTVYTWALWLGLAACVGMIVLGLRVKRYVLVGIGALGVFQFLPQVLQQVFPGEIAGPIAILAFGVALIGGGVAFAVRAQRKRAARVSEH